MSRRGEKFGPSGGDGFVGAIFEVTKAPAFFSSGGQGANDKAPNREASLVFGEDHSTGLEWCIVDVVVVEGS